MKITFKDWLPTNEAFVLYIFLYFVFALTLSASLYVAFAKINARTNKVSTEVVVIPSPVPREVELVQKPSLSGKPSVNVVQTNIHPLCKDVGDPWTLVADPEVSGQYIICNTEGGSEMADVAGLNVAVNSYRRANGLNTLNISSELCSVAAERAQEISVDFSHDGFEAAIVRFNIQKTVGENIASGPLTAVQFVEWSWDKSPGHRENMLSSWNEGCGGVFDRFAVYIFAK